jgi:hypothetical protein
MSTYFMLGCLCECCIFGPKLAPLYEKRPKLTLFLSIILLLGGKLFGLMCDLVLSGMLATLHLGLYQMTTIFSFLLGLCLYTFLLQGLFQIQTYPSVYVIAVAFTFAGVLGAIVTGLGDYVHYMNRDVNYFIYGVEGYIGVSVTIGGLLQICSTRYLC